MKISLNEIEAFIAVVEHESFNHAAIALGITQPALSRRIKKLEESLGARLLDRSTRKISLSVVGAEFLPEAKRMIYSFEKSIDEVQEVIQSKAGSISFAPNITIAETILPEVIATYRKKNPAIRLRVMEGASPEVMERVLNREVEFAIGQFGKGHPELEFEPLMDDTFLMICHKRHPLAKKKKIEWSDFKSHNFIKLHSEKGTMSILEGEIGEKIEYLSGDIQVGHFNALIGCIGQNLGVSAVPTMIHLKRPDLDIETRPITSPTVSRQMGIITLKGRSLSPAAHTLCQIFRRKLKGAKNGSLL